MQTQAHKSSNLQVELMKIFSYNLNESQLLEIKEILSAYFAQRATGEIDKLWKKNNWTNKTMAEWLKEHRKIV